MPELSDFERAWLLLLLALWAVQLGGGFLRGRLNAEGTHRIPRPLRMGSSLTLVIAAVSWWLLLDAGPLRDLALLVALGMTAGFVGDLFMAQLIVRGPLSVLGGMGMFGLGHVLYIGGLLRYADVTGLDDSAARWGALVVALLIGAVSWWRVVYRGASERSALHMVALPYALLLAATFGVGSGLALQSAEFMPLALGAALFLTSDLLIAAQMFSGLHFRGIGDVIWLTYGPAQMLIVYALPFSALF